jgi:hypothetical protein
MFFFSFSSDEVGLIENEEIPEEDPPPAYVIATASTHT